MRGPTAPPHAHRDSPSAPDPLAVSPDCSGTACSQQDGYLPLPHICLVARTSYQGRYLLRDTVACDPGDPAQDQMTLYFNASYTLYTCDGGT